MARSLAELFPSPNGANFDAEWKGTINLVGLHNATDLTFITLAAVTGAVQVAYTKTPSAGDWTPLSPAVTLTASTATTLTITPAVKAIRVTGVTAANPPPIRLIARLAD